MRQEQSSAEMTTPWPSTAILDEDERPHGLTEAEASDLRARGLGNYAPAKTTRTYRQILLENVFTFVNVTLYGLGVALIVLGRASDALITVGIALMNVLVSVVQEIRAKLTLDRIALLTRPKTSVIRDGHERQLDPSEIVLGDILIARPGDQFVVDGSVVAGEADVDESLLTGESEPVPKHPGDAITSASFCVSGSARYRADRVGARSAANLLTNQAKAFRRNLTPLQREVYLIIRVLLMMAVFFEILVIAGAVVHQETLVDVIRMSVIVVGLVPIGLFLAITVAYALGALRLVGKSMLTQQANAVESLSNVDVLCLDKTGTLTTNRLLLAMIRPLGKWGDAAARVALGTYVASLSTTNPTTQALRDAISAARVAPVEEVDFSSARKWGGLTFTEGDRTSTWILGAPDILAPGLADLGDRERIDAITRDEEAQGRRVLLFAQAPASFALRDEHDRPRAPQSLTPVCLVSLRDELRPEAREALRRFADAGIALKIISGDSPRTVSALAQSVGFDIGARQYVGAELDTMGDAELAEVADTSSVFGRVSPEAKARLIAALQRRGHYVAMVGDGVNDVLAMKQANLSIGLGGGSQAARSVADLVLLNTSFATMPLAFTEGQRIQTGMQHVLALFLTRLVYVVILLLALTVVHGFPFTPKQRSIFEFMTLGVPTLALVAWAHAGALRRRGLGRSLLHVVAPAGITVGLFSLGVYLVYASSLAPFAALRASPEATTLVAQSALNFFITTCGLLMIGFIVPPTRRWAGAAEPTGDFRPLLVAGLLFAGYCVALVIPFVRQFFELALLRPLDYLALAVVALIWAVVTRTAWRRRWFERYLGLEESNMLVRG